MLKGIISSAILVLLAISGCEETASDKNAEKQPNDTVITGLEVENSGFVGNYVSEGYAKRDEGNDWVAITIKEKTDSTYHLFVRSRADKKKPTCTFDTDALIQDSSTLLFRVSDKKILVTIRKNQLNISAENADDNIVLNYYCNGGGSFAGIYNKVNEPLDPLQADQRVFQKTLALQNLSYEVSAKGEGSFQQLIIQPTGLTENNERITIEIEGQVNNAEISDLNADGYPELLVYTTSAGSGSYGNVIGFSPNNGKSLSRIYFPKVADNPKTNSGYMGHDEFAIVGNTLVQRFPIYKKEDSNSNPTGRLRQIKYKLIDGEGSRKFVLDKVVEL